LRDGKSIQDALKVQASATATNTKAASNAAPAATAKTPAPPATIPGAATNAPAATTAAPTSVAAGSAAPAATTSPAETNVAEDLKSVMERGEKVYLNTCAVCHQPAGTGMPPTFPALKGDSVTTGPVGMHIHRVVFGKPGTAMQAFKDQLKDQEIADVVTYERNAWGNNKGDIIKPEQVKAARDQGEKQ
jgi:cytochrome c oxidase subunit 2